MDERARRIGENEAVYRSINERIEALNESFGTLAESMTVICECGNLSCAQQIDLDPGTYERVRSDPTQFDANSPYYDAESKPDHPRWLLLDVKALRKTRLLSLPEMRGTPELADMLVLRRGNRLSITPVEPVHWSLIVDHLLA